MNCKYNIYQLIWIKIINGKNDPHHLLMWHGETVSSFKPERLLDIQIKKEKL